MAKHELSSCTDKNQAIEPTATGARKILAEGGGETVVDPNAVAESSSLDMDTLQKKEPAMIDFSDLKATCSSEVLDELFLKPVETVLPRFLQLFETAFSDVSFVWEDIFRDPFSSKLLDVSEIPHPINTELIKWVKLLLEDEDVICYFVLRTFKYIVESVFGIPLSTTGDDLTRYENVSIFLALAVIVRNNPDALNYKPDSLVKLQRHYQRIDIFVTPLTVWMIHQLYQTNFTLGLRAWVLNLLPLLPDCKPQSEELILQFADKLMAQLEAHTIAKCPWKFGLQAVPPPSLEPLLRFRFPDPPATPRSEEDTARVGRIYTWLKDVALRSAPESYDTMEEIFTVSLRLLGQGNNDALVEEATAIAIWSLTENECVWEHWYSLCKENLEDSVALLKTLVEKWTYLPFKPSSRKAMKQQFIQEIFNISFSLAGQGAEEAAAIAMWSLTKSIDCWNRWDNLYKENMKASVALNLYEENMKASVALLQELEEKWNEHSLKLLSSPSYTLTLTQTIKSVRLKNKQNIALGHIFNDACLPEEAADRSCKVILGRLPRGLKGTCSTAVVVLVTTAVAAAALVLPVFRFYK